MKHLKRFNESIDENEKEFFIKDLSGRGAKARLSKSDIERTWDLSEEDDDTEQTLAEFLDDAEEGDTWGTNSVKITCI